MMKDTVRSTIKMNRKDAKNAKKQEEKQMLDARKEREAYLVKRETKKKRQEEKQMLDTRF